MKNKYEKYNKLLLEKFPSLKEQFNEYVSWQDGMDTGNIIVYEDIFVPYIIMQLVNDNAEEINKISELIEELLTSGDEYGFNIAYVAILESLKSDSNGRKIQKFLKPVSLTNYNELKY